MTTTVKVHVNGKYRATVTQDDHAPVEIEGNYNGDSGIMVFALTHPANSVFRVTEKMVAEGDERPATNVELSAPGIRVPGAKLR